MKRWMLSVVAAGALAVGGAASAQDVLGLGNVLPQILGNIGVPIYNAPGLGNVPQGSGTSVIDSAGRRISYDQYGRATAIEQLEIVVDKQGRRWAVDSEGRHTQVGQDYFGGVAGNPAFGGNRAFGNGDRDRDGVPNAYDRYPNDPRFR